MRSSESGKPHCVTQLLTDNPSDDDAFKSHSRLASVLEATIEGADRGQSIALIGPFGSGKSTIVQFMQKRFLAAGKKSKAAVFVFDAWVHQGDHLRRSFLESLRNFLRREVKWLHESDLEERFEMLAQRRQHVFSSSSPVITVAGAIVGLTLFSEPIWISWAARGWLIGDILVLLPPATALCQIALARSNMRVRNFLAQPLFEGDGPQDVSESVELHSLSGLFFKKTREESRSTTISSPDPTSVEFAEIFQEVLEKSLAKSDRRLVIVMDNLDRLDPETALRLMSTMRTFSETAARVGQADRVWLIVPFSPGWTAQLFNVSSADVSKKTDDSRNDEFHDLEILATSFLEKNFQLRVYVNEPSLSAWRDFLRSQLEQACPDHTQQSAILCGIYARAAKDHIEKLSPRAIKHFVNALTMIHRQADARIPFLTQAAYLLKAEDDLRKWVRSGGTTPLVSAEEQAELSDENWEQHFAAVYYNVPIEEALHVLLAPKLRAAITTGEDGELSQLMHIHGADAVCDWVLDQETPTLLSAPSMLALSAYALSNAEVLTDSVARRLRLARGKVSGIWSLTDQRVGQGIIALLRLEPQERQGTVLKQILTKLAPPTDEQPGGADQDLIWLQTLARILVWAKEAKLTIGPDDLRIGRDAKHYVLLLGQAIKLDEYADSTMLQSFSPTATPEEIIDLLGAGLNDESHAVLSADVLRMLPSVKREWPYDKILPLLARITAQPNPAPVAVIRSVIDALYFLSRDLKSSAAQEQIPGLIQNGQLLNFIWGDQDPESWGPVLYWYVQARAGVAAFGNAQATLGRFQQIISNPVDPSNAGFVDELTTITKPELRATLEGWADHKALHDAILSNALRQVNYKPESIGYSVISDYRQLQALGPETFDKILAGAPKDEEVRLQVVGGPFEPSLVNLYMAMLRDKEAVGATRRFLSTSMQAVSRAKWSQELSGGGDLLDLLIETVHAGESMFLGAELKSALLDQAKMLIEGNTIELSPDRCGAVMAALDEQWRRALLRDVENEAMNRGVITEGFAAYYGAPLVASDTLNEQDPNRVVSFLLRPLVAANSAWAAELLSKLIDAHSEIVKRADDASRSSLADSLVQALQCDSEAIRAAYERVQDRLQQLKLWPEKAAEGPSAEKTARNSSGNGANVTKPS